MTEPGVDADLPSAGREPDGRDVPAPLRAALVQAASDVLGTLEPVEVPASLRAVRQFAPRRRASAGAGPLWAALSDDGFRARVRRSWAAGHPEPSEEPSRPRTPAWDAAAA